MGQISQINFKIVCYLKQENTYTTKIFHKQTKSDVIWIG